MKIGDIIPFSLALRSFCPICNGKYVDVPNTTIWNYDCGTKLLPDLSTPLHAQFRLAVVSLCNVSVSIAPTIKGPSKQTTGPHNAANLVPSFNYVSPWEIVLADATKQPPKKQPHKCNCTMQNLLRYGCKCGGV